jgi:hypothetical protein
MSEHEAELRRRMALKDVDVYDTMVWFLAAIDAEGCVDRQREPDLSWFEREFLKDNMDHCRRGSALLDKTSTCSLRL